MHVVMVEQSLYVHVGWTCDDVVSHALVKDKKEILCLSISLFPKCFNSLVSVYIHGTL